MGNATEHAPEDQTVRQYRYLLRTAPLDALEEAHVDALSTVAASVREEVLTGVQQGLVAGHRLSPSETAKVAHLLTLGERRAPGDFLRACAPGALHALANAVIESEPAFGLFAGYAAWDGVDPAPADIGVDHGGGPQRSLSDDPAAAAKAFVNSHAIAVQPWAGGGF